MTYAPPRKAKINKNIVPKSMYNSLLLKYHRMDNRNRMLRHRLAFVFEEYAQIKKELDKALELIETCKKSRRR